jgi:hypothetical protein
VQRERAAYESELAKRFRLLSDAAAQYDAGNEDHVTNMAIHLRSLLTERLIDKVTPLDQLCFTDTADRLPEGPVAGYGFGLTRIRADAGWEDGSVGGGQIVAPLGVHSRSIHHQQSRFRTGGPKRSSTRRTDRS